MEIRKLTTDQVKEIYNTHMKDDFIPDELKLLKYILLAVKKGIYDCLGAFEDDEVVAYAFMVKQGDDYLLDYLAVYPEKRNGGIGSKVLGLLKDYYKNARSILIEVENPEFAKDDSENEIQTRRIDFYLRNGCVDTGFKVSAFGVPFLVLEIGLGHVEELIGIEELYAGFYREMLPVEIFKGSIMY